MNVIIGIDPSLTGTGVATAEGLHTITSKPSDTTLTGRRARLATIVHELDNIVLGVKPWRFERTPNLIVIEAPSLAQKSQAGTLDRNGLWWLIVNRLHTLGIPVVEVSPSTLKKFATGKGNATKEAMVAAAARRLPHVDTGDQADRADALWLAAMGADAYGCPLVDLPITHRAALDGVVWSGARRSA